MCINTGISRSSIFGFYHPASVRDLVPGKEVEVSGSNVTTEDSSVEEKRLTKRMEGEYS